MFILLTGDLNPFWITPMLGTHKARQINSQPVVVFAIILFIHDLILLATLALGWL